MDYILDAVRSDIVILHGDLFALAMPALKEVIEVNVKIFFAVRLGFTAAGCTSKSEETNLMYRRSLHA